MTACWKARLATREVPTRKRALYRDFLDGTVLQILVPSHNIDYLIYDMVTPVALYPLNIPCPIRTRATTTSSHALCRFLNNLGDRHKPRVGIESIQVRQLSLVFS